MMTTITKSALDSGTYKDKLTNILDNSRMLHLSEREAAKLYGEVIAGLITLQRRVRGWIEERNQVKDHNKVVARTKWEFGSFRKPDKEADAFRVQQRHSHGWRAPLNRRYAQLGSSVNEPLGRTAGVHTALGRKPEGAHVKVDRNLLGSRVTPLTLGEAHEGVVAKFGIARFVVQHDDPLGHLVLTVDSPNGDPDIFVGTPYTGDELPTLLEHTWSSSGVGADRLEIRPDDPKAACPCAYGIAVYGGGGSGSELDFTIRAWSYRPVGGSNAKLVATINNHERLQAERRFRLERRQAEERRNKVRFGQSAPAIMSKRENPEPSTAPPPPQRRLQGLEGHGEASAAWLLKWCGLGGEEEEEGGMGVGVG